MRAVRYQALGPLHAGEGSRALLGLAMFEDQRADPCVVVWVPPEAERDEALLSRIRRETEHAALLDHPNIVTVFGFAKLEQGHARVVEFADGESLRRILDLTKTLPPRMAARIIIDVCTGVHYAHLAGNDDGSPLVHGDLRPETVLLSFAGITKVTGYGALAFAPREAGGARVKGRRVHTTPEQIIGGRGAITIPSDVYLIGLSFYELLTGVVPWAEQGEGFDQAVLTYPLPPATPGLIPEALAPIIARACMKKAGERYPTPLAMREAIEAAMGSELATVEELSSFLDRLFPGASEIRADRKRTIDAGIADFARKQWARRDTQQAMPAVQLPAPPPTVVEPPQPPPPPPSSTPTVERPLPRPPPSAPSAPTDEEEPPASSFPPWVMILLGLVVAASGYLAYTKANAPVDPISTQPIVDADPVPAVAAVVDSGVVPDAGDPADAGLPPDAGVVVPPAVTPFDAGAAPTELAVEFDARPPVELSIDGVAVGKTPWSGTLSVGQHKLKLENRDLLINAARTFTVQGDQPLTQRFIFEKGTVAVTAPPGAIIFVDGKKQGVAPLPADLVIYEGFHRIMVKVGQAQWNETFTVYEGQRISFDVELE